MPEYTVVATMTAMHTTFKRLLWNTSIRHRHTMVEAVFTLPDHAAAMTRPCSTATRRMPETANSRSSTMARHQPGICPYSTK